MIVAGIKSWDFDRHVPNSLTLHLPLLKPCYVTMWKTALFGDGNEQNAICMPIVTDC